jgi:PAS domain S-box-containing protein
MSGVVAGLSVEAVLDGLDDGVLLNDPEGRVLYANPALGAMLGYTPEELVGLTLFDLVDDEGRASIRERLERRRRGVRERFDFRLLRKDGSSVWVLVAARPAIGADGGHLGSLVALTDITEHKAMAADLRQMRDQLELRVSERTAALEATNRKLALEVVERLAAEDAARWASAQKSRFLANISHELRTPLNAILGYTELVLDDPDTPVAHAAPDLDRVLSSARHLLELINDILDLSKVEAGHLELSVAEVDVGALVQEVCEVMRGRVQAGGNTLSVVIPDAPVWHDTDPLKLKQILFNLLSNAARFTSGGSVRVELEAGAPVVQVVDTGIGISAADQERIFEAFVQVGPAGPSQGTGLGLALSRQYARALGGDVTVVSAPGRGSRFTLRLGKIDVDDDGSGVDRRG